VCRRRPRVLRRGRHRAPRLRPLNARFDLARIVDGFRRFGGDEVAEIAERAYSGAGPPVTADEWARCWTVFGLWVLGDEERARCLVNADLNPYWPMLADFVAAHSPA
jgi:hypothetical protein